MDRFEAANQDKNARLDSWKEIAKFLSRTERTVKRWEKERGLPVHRLPGGGRATVFAYPQELTEWLSSAALADVPEPDQDRVDSDQREPGGSAPIYEASNAVAGVTPTTDSHARWSAKHLGLAAAVAFAICGIAWGIVRNRHAMPRLPVASEARAPHVQASSVAPHISNAEDLYLKGRFYWNKRTAAGLQQAVDYFTQAVVSDPNYAPAYAGLADCYNLMREFTMMPSSEAYPRAEAAARKAIELDDSLSEAHRALAFVLFNWSWDLPGAEKEFRRAIELNPKDVTAHHWYATSLLCLGRFQDAYREIEQARQLEPYSAAILADRALIVLQLGRRQEAITQLKQLSIAEPDFVSPHRYLANIYLDMGDDAEFLTEAKRSSKLLKDTDELAVLAAAERGFTRGGHKRMLEEMLSVQQKRSADGREPVYGYAETAAMLGRNEEAMRALNTAYAKHDDRLLSMGINPRFQSLRSDPRFRELTRKLGLVA